MQHKAEVVSVVAQASACDLAGSKPRSSERRSSRLQKVKIEIGTMLRGHFYNTNRVGYLVR